MSKSFVTLAVKICVLCEKTHETGELLMDTHLKNTFEHETIVGWELCEECTKKLKEEKRFLVVEVGNEIVNGQPKLLGRIIQMSERLLNTDTMDKATVESILDKRLAMASSEDVDHFENLAKELHDGKN